MKTTNLQVASKKVLFLVVIIGAALIVSMTINGVPTVAALDQIHSSREVSASVGNIWNTITNLSDDLLSNSYNEIQLF